MRGSGALPAALLLASFAAAQERPMLQVEPATLLDRSVLRLESGFAFREGVFLPIAGTSVNEHVLFDSAISYGIANNVEVEMHVPLVMHDSTRGHWDAGDIVLSTKFHAPRLLKASAVAFRFGVRLPQTDDTYGFGTDQMDFRADVLATWLRPRYQLHINLGLLLEDDPAAFRAQNDLVRYGIAFIYNRSISPVIEIAGRAGPTGFGTLNAHNLLIGARFARGSVVYDAGWSVGLNRDNHRFGLAIGVAWQRPLR
jgi:hypothetical protein